MTQTGPGLVLFAGGVPTREEAAAHAEQGESAREVERRLRLAVLREKRQAVTEMRDANEFDDIVGYVVKGLRFRIRVPQLWESELLVSGAGPL